MCLLQVVLGVSVFNRCSRCSPPLSTEQLSLDAQAGLALPMAEANKHPNSGVVHPERDSMD